MNEGGEIPITKSCKQCGAPFQANRNTKRHKMFCSTACRMAMIKANKQQKRELYKKTFRTDESAGRTFLLHADWICRGCGHDVPGQAPPKTCLRCFSTKFERIGAQKISSDRFDQVAASFRLMWAESNGVLAVSANGLDHKHAKKIQHILRRLEALSSEGIRLITEGNNPAALKLEEE